MFTALVEGGDERRPQALEAASRPIHVLATFLAGDGPVSAETEVEVDAVLPGLRFGDPLEEDPRTSALRIEKIDVWTPSKTWVRVWVKDITRRL